MRISIHCQKIANFQVCTVLFIFVALTLSMTASPQKLTMFDLPNAGAAPGSGPQPTGINIFGAITGIVVDNHNYLHGFIRTPEGESTLFDAPGIDPQQNGATIPTAINDFGVIVGWAFPDGGPVRAFRRMPDGTITTIKVPGATPYTQTYLYSINDFGVATGKFDSNGIMHAFRYSLDGKFTEIDDPEVGMNPPILDTGTIPYSINNHGEIGGVVLVSIGSPFPSANHGFLRTRKGEFIHFDVPEGIDSFSMINAYVNDRGVVAGTYVAQQAVDHDVTAGFQRSPDGSFIVFAAPTGPLKNLWVNALNFEGTTTGFFEDATTIFDHAFVRFDDGRLVPIRFPSSEEESVGAAINDRGIVVGWWFDSTTSTYHGYTWSPRRHDENEHADD